MQWRQAVLRAGNFPDSRVHLGPVLQEQLDDVRTVVQDGDVKRRQTVLVLRSDQLLLPRSAAFSRCLTESYG